MDALGIPKELEERIDALYKMLVPSSGPASTVSGEVVRAICKVSHRYYNDGDYWYKGYGIETAGPAAAFLMSSSCPFDITDALDRSDGKTGRAYERAIHAVTKKIAEYVESTYVGGYNKFDMLTFEPKYEVEEDDDLEEDDYY